MLGEFVWTGFDYIGEPTPYKWPSKSSYFGIVDTCGFPKDIYYFYQQMERQADGAYPAPLELVERYYRRVWAYSNCDTVELFLNGTSLGVKSMGNNGHVSWNVPWVPGTLRAKAVKGNIVVYDEVTTAGNPAKFS